MKYVSFIVEENGGKYCINVDNVNYFVESNKIKVIDDHRHEKAYKGLALFRDKLMRVVNTKEVFSVKNFKSNQIIVMNISETASILIPVLKIIGIFESTDIENISASSKQFNFIIKDKNDIFVLVENYFFNIDNL